MSFADTELKVIQRLERAGRKIKNPTPEQREAETNRALRNLQAACGRLADKGTPSAELVFSAGAALACLVHFAAANDFDLSLAFAEFERSTR